MIRLTTITAYYDQVGILSGGFTYFARRLQAEMGIDYVFANELDFVDGKLTGKVKGEIVDGERKALLLQQIAAENGLSLKQVGHTYTYTSTYTSSYTYTYTYTYTSASRSSRLVTALL
jgi:phosphoserine phosphatase